ncbi:hypothetical protein [Pseudomonas sp. NPDC090208]|uniref:hypothetical protein n=1 Tax=Pseudomonas sp. NPDC090208 TaxID=3364478 RepID=UPI00381BA144
MADPVIINPTLTLAGQAAAFNADRTGIELKITHASFGKAHYDPDGTEVALKMPVGSKIPLAGGSKPTPYQLRMSVAWREDVGEVPVGEIGFWSNDILVFVWSKADGSVASYKTDGTTYVLFNDLSFAQVPANSINIDIDPNESVALAALAAHEGDPFAHAQYLLRSDVAKDFGALNWLGLADGTPNGLVLTLEAPESLLPAYAAGQRFQFTAVQANTGPVTASIEGLAAVAVQKSGSNGLMELEAGDIRPSAMYELTFDGDGFQISGGGIGGGSSGSTSIGVAATYSKDTGAANAYLGTYLPAVTSLIDGMELVFLAKNANTGESTFSPNNVLAKPILDLRYGKLVAGKITAGSICTVRYLANLDAWVLTDVAGSNVPTTLAGYGITDGVSKADLDALANSQARVVTAPVVSGGSSVTAGTVVTLTATASSLLSGGTIASFVFVLPDGTSSTVAAASGSASKNVTVTGSVGTAYKVNVYAIDNAGNKSSTVLKSITVSNHAAPTVPAAATAPTTVYQGTTGNSVSVNGSTASDGATITYSIEQSGGAALTFSKTSGIAADEVVTFTAPNVSVDTPVTVNFVAVDSLGGRSAPLSKSVTVSVIPTVPGTPFGGGYYVGRMKFPDGTKWALVVAPASGGSTSYLMAQSSTNGAIPGTESLYDGAANTAAMIAAGENTHPAAKFCKNLTIGGFTDWHLPSKFQLEMLYHNFKPTTDANTQGNQNYDGVANIYADPPTGNYTATDPVQTPLAAFKGSGAESIGAGRTYWSSTQYSTNYQYCQHMTNGTLVAWYKSEGNGSQMSVRAVRMVKI